MYIILFINIMYHLFELLLRALCTAKAIHLLLVESYSV
jgi:hypothetical protein